MFEMLGCSILICALLCFSHSASNIAWIKLWKSFEHCGVKISWRKHTLSQALYVERFSCLLLLLLLSSVDGPHMVLRFSLRLHLDLPSARI
jgi:hypothetical protein